MGGIHPRVKSISVDINEWISWVFEKWTLDLGRHGILEPAAGRLANLRSTPSSSEIQGGDSVTILGYKPAA